MSSRSLLTQPLAISTSTCSLLCLHSSHTCRARIRWRSMYRSCSLRSTERSWADICLMDICTPSAAYPPSATRCCQSSLPLASPFSISVSELCRAISQPFRHFSSVRRKRNGAPRAPGAVGHTHFSRNCSKIGCITFSLGKCCRLFEVKHQAQAVSGQQSAVSLLQKETEKRRRG